LPLSSVLLSKEFPLIQQGKKEKRKLSAREEAVIAKYRDVLRRGKKTVVFMTLILPKRSPRGEGTRPLADPC